MNEKKELGFIGKIYYGFFMCWGCFSTIPCPNKVWHEEARNTMLSMLKYLGIIFYVIELLIFLAMDSFKISDLLIALMVTVFPFIVTGFIHLDGYMDCCDAILSRRSREERLRILKDPTVGAFAVIGLTFIILAYLVGSCVALQNIKGLCVVSIVGLSFFISRFMSSIMVMSLKPMEASQYKDSFKDKSLKKALILNLITGIIIIDIWAFIIGYKFGIYMLIPNVVGLVGHLIAVLIGVRDLGGMNGDISGFAIVWSETVTILALAAMV